MQYECMMSIFKFYFKEAMRDVSFKFYFKKAQAQLIQVQGFNYDSSFKFYNIHTTSCKAISLLTQLELKSIKASFQSKFQVIPQPMTWRGDAQGPVPPSQHYNLGSSAGKP